MLRKVIFFFTLAVFICAFFFSCCSPSNRSNSDRFYKLSWMLNTHNNTKCPEYILDGKNLGCEGSQELLKLGLGKGDCIQVMIGARSLSFIPYCYDGLFNEWVKNGVRFEYFHEGEKRELHRLSWEGEGESDWPGILGPVEPIDPAMLVKYTFDDKVIGSGYGAYRKLLALNIPKGSFVQVMYPPARSDYEFTFTKIPEGVLHLTREWKERGIYVEALRLIRISR